MFYSGFEFYDGKKVLVCGASGLSGRNLYELLLTYNAKVTGTYFSDNGYYSAGKGMFTQVDFTDPLATSNFFVLHQFDYVFICCAKTYNAQTCKDNPESMLLPNIQMVSNILSSALKNKVKKVLYISSATVYQPSSVPILEENLDWNQNPHSLYMGIGWCKRYIEKLCEFYSTRGLPTLIVRPTNIYGCYDKTDEKLCHVVPAFIMRALRMEDPYIVHSQGNGIKNFIHANDFVRDLARVMDGCDTHNVFNVCSNEEYSIAQVVHLIIEAVQKYHPSYKPEIRFEGKPDAIEYIGVKRSKLDSMLGKESYITLSKGLEDVVAWYSLLPQTPKQPITV